MIRFRFRLCFGAEISVKRQNLSPSPPHISSLDHLNFSNNRITLATKMATPHPNLAAADQQVTRCKRCQLTFATWRDFNVHQKLSNRHMSCPSCSTEYKTMEGAQRHWKQVRSPRIQTYLVDLTARRPTQLNNTCLALDATRHSRALEVSW